jgi:hypothetical protein
MPPRTRTASKTKPVAAEENGSRSKLDNLEKYLNRDFTPVMADYVEWFTANVGDPDQLASDRLIVLAVNFYSEFQASDFNRERREERRAAREQAAEPEPEPAKATTRRGRGRPAAAAKPAAAKPGRKPGRKPAAASSGADVY